MNDTDDSGDGNHSHLEGIDADDRLRLASMVNRLRADQPSGMILEVFATVGAAVLAADTLKGMGFKVHHNVLAVEGLRNGTG